MSREAPSAGLACGVRLGRYEIEVCIGAGGMGSVYRAHDVDTGTTVALKRLLEPSAVAAVETEARLLALLSHPRVTALIDHFHDPEAGYTLVTEFIDGPDLARVLWDRGEPGLPVEEVLERAREACEALAYVHSQQIVHADLKPSNIVCGSDGSVLVDFGLATRVSRSTGASSAGTARFLAPEVFAGDPPSPQSDVYSLAASIWNLLAGSPPVYGDDTRLSRTVPGVSPAREDARNGALELRPEQRTASAAELASSLDVPIGAERGRSLAASVEDPGASRELIEAVVRAAAGIFEAAATSIALTDPETGELCYVAAWGSVANEVLGLRLPHGDGIAGAAVTTGKPQVIQNCRTDPRFAAEVAHSIGYVPTTMLVVPLWRGGLCVGALCLLDRRDGTPYGAGDLPRAVLFAELAAAALQ